MTLNENILCCNQSLKAMDHQTYKICLLGEFNKGNSFDDAYLLKGEEVIDEENEPTHFEYPCELETKDKSKKIKVQVIDYTDQGTFGSWRNKITKTDPNMFVIFIKNLVNQCNINKLEYFIGCIRKITMNTPIVVHNMNSKEEDLMKENYNWMTILACPMYSSRSSEKYPLDDLIVRSLVEGTPKWTCGGVIVE